MQIRKTNADDPQLQAARATAHTDGPIATILAAMHPDGYWGEPGPGYNPKYRSTVWSLIMLAQLGGSAAVDERIARACTCFLEASLTPIGQFTASGAPSTTVDCLQGNMCVALLDLGCDDPRLGRAFEWLARSVTGEGVAPAAYPTGYADKPSGNWWKLGFPVFYVTDLLQTVEALVGLGYGADPRLANALALIRRQQDAQGRWTLEYDYAGKTWVDGGAKKQPNKWVTLRALRVLRTVG